MYTDFSHTVKATLSNTWQLFRTLNQTIKQLTKTAKTMKVTYNYMNPGYFTLAAIDLKP